MAELDHIDHAHGCRLVEPVSGAAVAEHCLTELRYARIVGVSAYFIDACTVENRGAELQAEFCARPSENGLVDLAEVHS